MAPDASELLENALRLPDEQRAEIAVSLIDSLDKDRQAAWDMEISRRVRELDDGSVMPIPWSETWSRLRGKLDGLSES